MTKAETENDVVEVGHMRLTVLACAHAEAAAKSTLAALMLELISGS